MRKLQSHIFALQELNLFPIKMGTGMNASEGYIDKLGNIKIRPIFEVAGPFSDGLAIVLTINGKFGAIDCRGNFIIEPRFDYLQKFTEGLARFQQVGKWGFINRSGKIVIPANFYSVGWISEGLAVYEKNSMLGYINTKGDIVIEAKYSNAHPFEGGIAAVQNNSGFEGFINNHGEVVIRLENLKVYSNFFDSLAVVFNEEKGGFGYIDKSGKIVIRLQFSQAMPFSDGLAMVQIGGHISGKWGFINKTGEIVIEPKFEVPENRWQNAGKFSEGIANVMLNGGMGYINKKGKFIVEPIYDDCSPFNNGLGLVMLYNKQKESLKQGYVDKNGKVIWSPGKSL